MLDLPALKNCFKLKYLGSILKEIWYVSPDSDSNYYTSAAQYRSFLLWTGQEGKCCSFLVLSASWKLCLYWISFAVGFIGSFKFGHFGAVCCWQLHHSGLPFPQGAGVHLLLILVFFALFHLLSLQEVRGYCRLHLYTKLPTFPLEDAFHNWPSFPMNYCWSLYIKYHMKNVLPILTNVILMGFLKIG